MDTLRKIYFLLTRKLKLNKFEFFSKITQKLIYDFIQYRYIVKKRNDNTNHISANDIKDALKNGDYYKLYEHIEIDEKHYDEFIIDYLCFNLKDYKYKITICFKDAQLTIHKKKVYGLYNQ